MINKSHKVLITGAGGFSAKYLIQLLLKRKGLRLSYVELRSNDKKDWYKCDLGDFYSAHKIIQKIKPDQIYNLAGTFSGNYETDYKTNVTAVKNIFDSVLMAKIQCRILLIGSAAEYGNVPVYANPVSEDYPLNPASIYGLTKVYQTYLMKYYFSMFNMDIVMARAFNLFGKGISNKLFIGRLYEQIEEYKNGRVLKIIVGNLKSKRDYLDIKEAVKYYEVIMNYGIPGEIYNVGSGKSVNGSRLMQTILKENHISADAVVSRHNADKKAKEDVSDIYANVKKMSMLEKHIKDR
ncbi:MAG: GDP-mannose 4,6-dehydratase [Candidatus Omnitrophica bacterium]|nr:GDP-mannose 4,6-dehydratase [Candidatus Omnitrophota bacterium]